MLDFYFDELRMHSTQAQKVEEDWRPLYRVAWADFHRFLKGWSPGHWKLSDYSERVAKEVITSLREAKF